MHEDAIYSALILETLFMSEKMIKSIKLYWFIWK